MSKFRKLLTAAIIFSSLGFSNPATARESFYNLTGGEPSVSINLGALDRLEPAYTPPPPQPVKTYKNKTTKAPALQVTPKVKQLPFVSDNIEPPPTPAPIKQRLSHGAPALPVVNQDFSQGQPSPPPPPVKTLKPVDTTPPPPPQVVEPKILPPPSAPLKKIEQLPPAPTPLPKPDLIKYAPPSLPAPPPLPPAPPLKKLEQLPSAPPPLPNNPDAIMAPPPPPPPLPKADSVNSQMPRVVVSSKSLPPSPPDLPKVSENKNTDNFVALPSVPPAPPPPPSKTLVAASKDLPTPPPLPAPPKLDSMPLPPPLPPAMPDLDQKIAEEKAKINKEEIKSKTAVKNATAKLPTPKDLANTPPSLPDLPPMPAPPPPLDNGLPPLPGAPSNNFTQGNTKPSDLPPLDNALSNSKTASKTSTSKPELVASSVPAKETVMVQPNKITTSSTGSGVITMPYSEAETDVPLVEKSKLDNVISQLEADKSISVTVIAYASGTPEQSSQAKRTSLARVLAVRKYMMERNIDPDRINPRPLGNKAEGGVPDRVDLIVEKTARG